MSLFGPKQDRSAAFRAHIEQRKQEAQFEKQMAEIRAQNEASRRQVDEQIALQRDQVKNIPRPPSPAATPSRADASVVTAGRSTSARGLASLITTAATGLTRKGGGQKRTLIGGA